MPHLKSFAGMKLSTKYVKNWYCLFLLYSNILSSITAKFKDGQKIFVSKDDFLDFYEELFKRYLKDKGFIYESSETTSLAKTPNGIILKLPEPPYSFVLDEIFIMKVYGEPNLVGRTVIDVGCSIGDSSLYFASLGAAEIFCFEIDKSLVHLAMENFKANHLLSKIHIYNKKATSKLIQELIFQRQLKSIFMKIDCEGCEYEIIGNLDKYTFQNLHEIVLEYHGDMKPLVDKLLMAGFKVRRKKEILYANRQQPLLL